MSSVNRTFSIAPMMDWSDRHCRVFWRQLTSESLLYTEMVTTGAILHAGPERFLQFNKEEHPVALQLGGSNSKELAQCATIAQDFGYDEVNLNCGCPSDRVQSGMFGACLMAKPQLVADCIKAMQDACDIPITVKHRIGIDDMESYDELVDFMSPIIDTGCKTFIIHARKAWLEGLSPKENREIPPLNYPMVYQLKTDFPDLEIIINGGITSIDETITHLQHIDGVMMGRSAYQNPYLLAEIDQKVFGMSKNTKPREQVLLDFIPYVEEQLASGTALNHMSRHLLGLYQGVPGAKQFRRHLSQHAHKAGAGTEVLLDALALVKQAEDYVANRRAG